MRDHLIEEGTVATVGRLRIALAKTWNEERSGGPTPRAWLSLVEKGSDVGQQDVEASAGETVRFGTAVFRVVGIEVGAGERSGSVRLTFD